MIYFTPNRNAILQKKNKCNYNVAKHQERSKFLSSKLVLNFFYQERNIEGFGYKIIGGAFSVKACWSVFGSRY